MRSCGARVRNDSLTTPLKCGLSLLLFLVLSRRVFLGVPDMKGPELNLYLAAMGMIPLGVGTVVRFLLQGMGVVKLLMSLLELEHNPLEGMGRAFLWVDGVPEGRGERNAEPFLVVLKL